jgi:hypothetical protein
VLTKLFHRFELEYVKYAQTVAEHCCPRLGPLHRISARVGLRAPSAHSTLVRHRIQRATTPALNFQHPTPQNFIITVSNTAVFHINSFSLTSATPVPLMPSTSNSSASSSSYFTYPVSYAVTGLLRRLNSEPAENHSSPSGATSLSHSMQSLNSNSSDMNSVFAPPHRKASPFQPPPLTPLSLNGYRPGTRENGKLLSKALAEEIRLLVPPRLQLVDGWELCYSLEQNGVSLGTLYQRAEEYRGKRGGFVLVVRDGDGGVGSCQNG